MIGVLKILLRAFCVYNGERSHDEESGKDDEIAGACRRGTWEVGALQNGGQGKAARPCAWISGSTRWWIRNIPAFAEHYTVYLVDLPGFGTLARTPRFGLAEAYGWLLDWFHATGLQRAN